MEPTIVTAGLGDLPYIKALACKFSNQLGFLPTPAIEEYLQQSWVTLTKENGEPAGYLLGRPRLRWQPLMRPITQAAVAMDAQRRQHGLRLVADLCGRALADGKQAVQCCCANDIDAMSFWPMAGFVKICELSPENARGRLLTCWRRCLSPTQPAWFYDVPKCSGSRARRTNAGQLFLFSNSATAATFKR